MAAIISNFKRINRELRYGVIYVVTSLGRYSNGDEIITRQLPTRLMEWLGRLTGFEVEVVESPEARGTTLVARRINVGNAGSDAVVEMPLINNSFSDVRRFVNSATDVLSTDHGDQMLSPEVIIESCPDASVSIDLESLSRERMTEVKNNRSWLNKFQYREKKDEAHAAIPAEECVFDECGDSVIEPSVPTEIDLEEEELLTIEQQQEAALKAIQAQILDYVTKYQADPSQLIHTLLDGKIVIGNDNRLSPLVVNQDMKIVLPYYNEVEVKMPAMCRAIYILFLKHPEGIALRNIADHRADLENIYSIVMPGRSEEKAREAIDNLIDPMSNTLNEYISKIKRCFKTCIIDEKLADNYCITGKRGEPYRVILDSSFVILPRAVTNE